MAKPWKMSDGPKHPDDILISDCLPRREADAQMVDQAKVLKASGQTDQFGVYVAKYGKGHGVYLHNRDNDSFDVS